MRYFFDDGLFFECQRCGCCCTGAPGTIYVGPAEMPSVAAYLNLSAAQFIQTYLYPFKDAFSIREDDRGNCLFFEKGCRIYPVRPVQCRSFPFWFSNLRSEACWERVRRQCPGIGKGRCFSRAEIMAWARRTTML
jgi:uncharacterized protein